MENQEKDLREDMEQPEECPEQESPCMEETCGEPEDSTEKSVEEEEQDAPAPKSGHVKLVTDQGLSGDEYCVSEPWVESDRLDSEEEEELSGIEIRYDLKPEEARAAMKAFQRKNLFKKNMIYTVVLGVLALLYLQSVIRNPDYSMGKVLGVFSVVVIALLWYLPARHINQTVKGIALSTDTFTIEISEVGFLIREEGGKYLVRYNTPTVFVLELEEVFVVCVSREKMFAIPKRCVPEEEMEQVKQLMKDGLGSKYENWIKS